MSDKRGAFFGAIKKEKMDTIRWSLTRGGISAVRTEDADGRVGLHVAAALGRRRSLMTILEYMRRARELDDANYQDADGMSALMMAAANGHADCVKLLLHDGRVKTDLKDNKGRTARDFAERRSHATIVRMLDGESSSEEEEEDEEEAPAAGAAEGKKKGGMVDLTRSSARAARRALEGAGGEEDGAAVAAAGAAEPAPEPQWPEVASAMELVNLEPKRECAIVRTTPEEGPESGEIDPALWHCTALNRLTLRLPPGVLTELPADLGRLANLLTLIVSGNALTKLPEEVGALTGLRVLEADGNRLTELPAALASLSALETLHVSDNCLTSLAPAGALPNLVSLHADRNQLTQLDLQWDKLARLDSITAAENAIEELPADVANLGMLTHLNLKDNRITQIPPEMVELKKKLKHLTLQGNPIADRRVLKLVAKDDVGALKDLFSYLAKQGKGGKKGKKGKR